jgi:esterase/lipase superfamily enzyme
MGALYSALFALKHPETFRRAVCLSGRYRASTFGHGQSSDALYFNDPLAFVPNLSGVALARVRLQTHLTLVVGRGARRTAIGRSCRSAARGLVVGRRGAR